jgi:hypothetical protein
MPTRYDVLFILTWTAIIAAAIAVVVGLFWLVQQAFLAVYPIIKPHAERLLAIVVTLSAFALVVAAWRGERGR